LAVGAGRSPGAHRFICAPGRALARAVGGAVLTEERGAAREE